MIVFFHDILIFQKVNYLQFVPIALSSDEELATKVIIYALNFDEGCPDSLVSDEYYRWSVKCSSIMKNMTFCIFIAILSSNLSFSQNFNLNYRVPYLQEKHS